MDGRGTGDNGSSGRNVHKFKPDKEQAKPSRRLRYEGDPPPIGGGGMPKPDKKAVGGEKRIEKSKLHMEKSGDKLDAAREKLAAQKPVKKPGAAKTTIHATKAEAWGYVHGKIHQVEDENAGVAAAHRAELAGESALRDTSRFVKRRIRTRPERRVRTFQKQSIKATADHNYRVLTQEQPELRKNALSRYLYRKRIKKKYQKQVRDAAAKAAKKTAEKTGQAAVTAVKKVGGAVVNFVKSHPIISLILILVIFLIVSLQSCTSGVIGIGNGIFGSVAAAVYPSDDAEMLAAEDAYAGMETALQYELDNYPRLHSGYDEYHYDLDDIGHDPYVLISILSALHEGAWTLRDVQGALSALFDMQYTLTETVTVETRYRTETDTVIDLITNESYEVSVDVPYNYYICTVTLDNFNLSHLPIYIMGEDALSRYALYMATLGCRPDLFPVHLYPRASTYKEYGRYDVPQEYLDADPVFAAMLEEAEKYLGYPYIWGGYNPNTSFDCSGFVSWVINHSGWNVGRLDAQGLCNICTSVSAASARPGDLAFFVGTYDTPGVSHVGIYVGDGMLLHAGDPIGYISIAGSYYQSHLLGYGRLP